VGGQSRYSAVCNPNSVTFNPAQAAAPNLTDQVTNGVLEGDIHH
jgi:hypothetical protein